MSLVLFGGDTGLFRTSEKDDQGHHVGLLPDSLSSVSVGGKTAGESVVDPSFS
jgi:hypothetical protein